jgi:hypothetical protein
MATTSFPPNRSGSMVKDTSNGAGSSAVRRRRRTSREQETEAGQHLRQPDRGDREETESGRIGG